MTLITKKKQKLGARANGQTLLFIPKGVKVTTETKVDCSYVKDGKKLTIIIEED